MVFSERPLLGNQLKWAGRIVLYSSLCFGITLKNLKTISFVSNGPMPIWYETVTMQLFRMVLVILGVIL